MVFDLVYPNGDHAAVREYYRYGMETESGDCGSLLVACDVRFNRKICAIHMAGNSSSTYSAVGCALTQETVEDLLAFVRPNNAECMIDGEVTVDKPLEVNIIDNVLVANAEVGGAFTSWGSTNTPVHQNTKSQLSPSVIYGVCGEVERRPAHLKPVTLDSGERVDPMELGQRKAATPSILVDSGALKAASSAVRNMIARESEYGRVFTHEESIAGLEGDINFPPINRSSSPGYGWTKTGKGKQAFLGHQEYVFDHPEVLAALEKAEHRLSEGKPLRHFWCDTLKDELRPMSKVAFGKSRLFAAGEMIFSMLCRRYFGGFTAHMHKNLIDFESCVGVNVYSLDWNRIGIALRSKSAPIVAGDFTNYDGTLPADLLWEVLDVIEAFYRENGGTPAEAHIRRLLWVDIVNSVHVCRDQVYSWNHSQPSGCVLTTVLNCVAHSILVRAVFMLCAKKHSPANYRLDVYDRHVKHFNYGDDDVTNISPEIVAWFNQQTMAEAYATFGMTYTDEQKSRDLQPYKALEEIEFLKRKFRWDNDQKRFLAPLSLKTVLEMPSWVRNKAGPEQSVNTLLDAAYELSQHDRDTWNAHIGDFERAAQILRSHGQEITIPTYDSYVISDAAKYLGLEKILGDRGFRRMAIKTDAANPAQGSFSELVGEVFTSSDECLPASGSKGPNRILISPTTGMLRSAANVETGPAQTSTSEVMAQPGEAAPQMAEQQEITTFHQDGATTSGGDTATTRASGFYKDAEDALRNSVMGFLQRPFRHSTFKWEATAARLEDLAVIDFPQDFLSKEMYRNKLQGFKYMRCDFIVELQVNAMPFNAGGLMLWFEPLHSQQGTASTSATRHYQGVSGFPNMIYRIGENTSIKFRIPFFPTISHYDLVNREGLAGRLHVSVWSGLSGGANVECSTWMWAENIDIQMPVGLPVESGVAQVGDDTDGGESGGASESAETWTAVNESKSDGTKKERKFLGMSVEQMLKVGSGVAGVLTAVPGIGAVAALGSGILSGAAAVAHFFGWSKPLDKRPAEQVQITAGKFFTNFNGDYKGRTMALDANNATNVPTEVFHTQNDEMAFNTILRQHTALARFTVAVEDPIDALLAAVPVNPTFCRSEAWQRDGDVYVKKFNETRLSYVSRCARLWRGALKYKFQFFKTQFHSVRLRFTFVPGFDLDKDDVTKVDWNACYTEVHDLRQQHDVEIEIPYVSNQPWLNTWTPSRVGGALPTDPIYIQSTGTLFVHVLNALRAPPTVAPNIECVVWVAAGDDFQLAVPSIPDDWRVEIIREEIKEHGAAQVGMTGTTGMSATQPNEVAIGEVFTGFRQWLRRFLPAHRNLVGNLHPWNWLARDDSALTNQQLLDRPMNPFEICSQLYRFTSGPMRVAALHDANPLLVHHQRVFDAAPGVDYTDYQSNAMVVVPPNEPYYELEVPFYQSWPAIPTNLGYPFEAGTSSRQWRVPSNSGGRLIFDPVPQDKFLFVASGEGFSFGYIVGQPRTGAIRSAV